MTLATLHRRMVALGKQFARAIDAETDALIAARPKRQTRYSRRLEAMKAGKRLAEVERIKRDMMEVGNS